MEKSTRAVQISDTVEFRHHHISQPEVTPVDCIVHGVKKLTVFYNMPLRTRVTINYSLSTRYSRQSSAGQRAIHLHVRNCPGLQSYILAPDRAPSWDLCAVPAKTDPPEPLPRVFIPKPPDIPIPPTPTTSPEEPIARRTQSRLPAMDQAPPRVHKTIDTAPIARRKNSQIANMASAITPARTAQRRYLSKFLQSLAMPVLDKTSSQSL